MAYLLDEKATGTCPHGGNAKPIAGNPRVKVDGSPVLTMISQMSISGCTNNPSGTAVIPCTIAMFTSAATRVKVMGMPVLLDSSKTTNIPTGAATTVSEPQQRVKGI
jgi:hypothetical protein